MAKDGTKSGGMKMSNVLVWTLLAILIVSLAGFGLGGFGGQVRSIGSVGGTDINLQTYARSVDAELRRLREQTGQAISFAEAEQFGVTQRVLQNQVGRAALEEAARVAGISVGDEVVAQRLRAMPAFQGLNGGFDREAYSFALDRAGLTVGEFERGIRNETASTILQNAMVASLTPPAIFGETLYRYIAEERSVTYVTFSADDLETAPDAPTAAEVQAYYDVHPDQFTLPERKAITFVALSPADMQDQVDVTEDELRALYDNRDLLYNRPERRMVSRLGFPDQAAAEAARAAIDAGDTTFEALVQERGLTLDDVDLGAVSATGLTDEAAEAVFGLEDNGVAGPVDSAVGPALFNVNAILIASFTPFEEARDELRNDLSLELAGRLVDEEIEVIDDLLAGGATLEEVADETPAQLGTIEWSVETPGDDRPVTLPEFQGMAQAMTSDDFPEVVTTQAGTLFAMRLDQIIPAALQPFEDVEAEAEIGAAEQKTRDALRAEADLVIEALTSGTSLMDQGLEPTTIPGINRQSLAFELPLPMINAIYDMAEGDHQIFEDGALLHLAQVTALTPPDTSAPDTQAVLSQLSAQTAQAMSDDMLTLFSRAISAEAGIRLDQAAIDAVHNNFR